MGLTDEHYYRVAKIAYDGYVKQAGGVSLATGDKLPEFDGLKQSIKDAWVAAIIAVDDPNSTIITIGNMSYPKGPRGLKRDYEDEEDWF